MATSSLDTVKFLSPEENIQIRPELLNSHLKATGGRVVTRFPPEPNGFLHLGHVKAMNLNFGYAKKNNGLCYMRFDDTNPETEKQIYIDSILENLTWLGHTPYKITYASDYFDQMYEFACELIRKDNAYIDFSTSAEMSEQRLHQTESKWRSLPTEKSLSLFEDMRNRKFKEGEVTLRLKQDMTSPNPCMRDLVAYRIKYLPHPRTGDKWCIYPNYDFAHPICDSLENITHSLCTLEFEIRRESYNWLMDTLGIYRAPQIEYSRLNLTHTVLSKRKLIQLVDGHYVDGWDDPRMPTVNGMRRRGVLPEALKDFCERIGVTRNANVISLELFEQCIRQSLENVPRIMCVLNPLRVVITNWDPNREPLACSAKHHPVLDNGSHDIFFGPVIYIDRNDFREQDEKTYYGLAPGKEVGLKYAYNIRCNEIVRDTNGHIIELHCIYDEKNEHKVKGRLHWVSENSCHIEVRLYDRLFRSEDTSMLEEDWIQDLNPAVDFPLERKIDPEAGLGTSHQEPASGSKTILETALIDPFVMKWNMPRYQFERIGYFCLDPDSSVNHLVFNRTVSLKDTYHRVH